MLISKVYVKGAYGPGNLGDDVLLIIMINILKKKFLASDISVGVENPEVAKVLDENVNWVHYKKPVRCDYLIYGGGGQFFSFKKNGTKDSQLSRLLNGIKKQCSPIDVVNRLFVKLNNGVDDLVVFKKSLAFCIGFGPFECDGFGTQRAKDFLNKVDHVIFRDWKSYDFYLSLGGNLTKTAVRSDPSFNRNNWFGYPSVSIPNGCVEVFIFRYWPYTHDGAELINAMMDYAINRKKAGKKVRFVCLDKEKDYPYYSLHDGLDWLIYDPSVYTPSEFMIKMLCDSKLIVSSRAHGVWLSSILGFPSIALKIENKLEQVHKSLSNSSMIIKDDDFDSVVCKYYLEYASLKIALQKDLINGINNSIQAEEELLEWLSCNEKCC
jgi:polysaccharide pyruvyl transferase WcaK-like protein